MAAVSLTVSTVNVNGIRAAVKQRSETNLGFLPWLESSGADVVALQEVRADEEQTRKAVDRTAEATGLRVLLTSVMKDSDTPVIVLGDVNDGQSSNTVNILTEQPRYLVGESRGGADNGLYTAQTLQEYREFVPGGYTPRPSEPAATEEAAEGE